MFINVHLSWCLFKQLLLFSHAIRPEGSEMLIRFRCWRSIKMEESGSRRTFVLNGQESKRKIKYLTDTQHQLSINIVLVNIVTLSIKLQSHSISG